MQAFDDLTASGLLYEGNRREWKGRIEAALRTLLFDFTLARPMTCISPSTTTKPARYWLAHSRHMDPTQVREDSAKLLEFLKWQVSPAFMARIPDIDRHDAAKLIGSLLHLARPFRLLDLPTEIRLRIFEEAIPHEFMSLDIEVAAQPDGCSLGRMMLPGLVRTSRLIREESTPIFFARTTIMLYSSRDKNDGSDLSAIHGLVKHLPPTYLARLRHINLRLECEMLGGMFRAYPVALSWSASAGVTIENDISSYQATSQNCKTASTPSIRSARRCRLREERLCSWP